MITAFQKNAFQNDAFQIQVDFAMFPIIESLAMGTSTTESLIQSSKATSWAVPVSKNISSLDSDSVTLTINIIRSHGTTLSASKGKIIKSE